MSGASGSVERVVSGQPTDYPRYWGHKAGLVWPCQMMAHSDRYLYKEPKQCESELL